MIRQNIWIGITIAVFFAGLGIGFAVFSNLDQPINAFHNKSMFNQMMRQNPQTMSWMMEDPQAKQQMFQEMMQNSDQLRDWIAKDPKHIEQISKIMKEDHIFMSKMMSTMMNDPDLRLQMVGHMSENPEALKQMMNMWNSGNVTNNMSGMMNSSIRSKQIQEQAGTQTETTSPFYLKIVDGIQEVTVYAKEFKFTPSEINIKPGKTKFILINNGVGVHEFVVYEASKKDIVDKAELAEDEDTLAKNVLFEIDELDAGQSKESEIMNLQAGSYIIGCHIPGHYEAGMKGNLEINP